MKCFFPVDKINKQDKVAIWGGGQLGRELLAWNKRFSYCDIVCFIDKKLKSIDGEKVPVYGIDKLKSLKIDWLIISIISNLDLVEKELDAFCINKDRCIFISEGYLHGNYSYSQQGEDVIVTFLLKHILLKEEISYCDIGANDPIDLNNTYLLHDEFKIKEGVSIDPNPLMVKKFVRTRKNHICINVGVYGKKKDNQDKMKFYLMDASTLSSFSYDSILESEKFGFKLINEIDVECVGINELFEQYFSGKIDFLNVDAEGMDLEIISGIDFDKYAPAVICAETSAYSVGKDAAGLEMIHFLLQKGYVVYADTCINTIFVLKAEIEKHFSEFETIDTMFA